MWLPRTVTATPSARGGSGRRVATARQAEQRLLDRRDVFGVVEVEQRRVDDERQRRARPTSSRARARPGVGARRRSRSASRRVGSSWRGRDWQSARPGDAQERLHRPVVERPATSCTASGRRATPSGRRRRRGGRRAGRRPRRCRATRRDRARRPEVDDELRLVRLVGREGSSAWRNTSMSGERSSASSAGRRNGTSAPHSFGDRGDLVVVGAHDDAVDARRRRAPARSTTR